MKTVASCSVVSVLKRMGGNLAQTEGLTILNTSKMSEVSIITTITIVKLGVLKIQGKREIQQLQVRCANTERGCQWTGTVDTTFDNHIASCPFALVSCPNKCEEGKGAGELLFIRKHLDQHLNIKCTKRPYECRHCGKKGAFSSIEEEHYKSCKKKIVSCPIKKGGVLFL